LDVGNISIGRSDYQFQLTLSRLAGIDAGDEMFRAKQHIKEFTAKRICTTSFDPEAIFMTKPDAETCSNGLHFSHSIRSLFTDGEKMKSEFHDPIGVHGLSEVGRYWLAGLVKHAGGFTALCNPTVNCYRRLRDPDAPRTASWSFGDRTSAFHLKHKIPNETYVKNRLPGGSANPYIVLAATVAAGMAGIKNKYPPPQSDEELPLPQSLSEALCALEMDKVLVEALGEEFIHSFISIKRKYEVDVLTKDSIEEEQEMYWEM